jgi:TolA-binding protein
MKPITLLTLALSSSLALAQDAPSPEARKDAPGAHGEHHKERGADVNERMARMKREIQELHRAGKQDEAERLTKELQAFAREQHSHKDGAREGRPENDVKARLQHLEQAIAHLRKAGMEEPAANLENAARGMRARLEHGEGESRRPNDARPGDGEGRREGGPRDGDGRREGGPREADGRREGGRYGEGRGEARGPRDGDARPDAAGEVNPLRQMNRQMQQMQEQMQRMNREMEELREALRRERQN